MTSDPKPEAEREAARWFARLSDRTVTVSDLEAFRAWRETPENRAAYDSLEKVWSESGALAQDPAVRAALADARDRPQKRVRRRGALLTALAAMLVAGAALGVHALTRPEVYLTGFGERRLVRLADGSDLHLDADSRVEVRLDGERRRLRLTRGQALFVVAHEAARPFTVQAGDTQVTATGTRFDVRLRPAGTEVTLIEGGVDVEREVDGADLHWRLTPGQQIQAAASEPRSVGIDAASRWTEGRLAFDRTPLAEALAEVARYDRQRIEAGPGLARLEVSGVFDAGDAAGFADAVAQVHGLRLEHRGDRIRLLAASADDLS